MPVQHKSHIDHEFIKLPKNRIKDKPISLGNKNSNTILKIILLVLGNRLWKCNIKYTYIDKDGTCLGILSAEALAIRSTENGLKFHTTVQLIFMLCDSPD